MINTNTDPDRVGGDETVARAGQTLMREAVRGYPETLYPEYRQKRQPAAGR